MPTAEDPASMPRGDSEDRSAMKRQAIVRAAREVFLANGYSGTTMDAVAATANVSKMTVYKHFSDKHSLFIAVFTGSIDEAEERSRLLVDHLGASEAIEQDLQAFAREHITLVTQPHLIQLRRMIIAEANRFPELAASWHRAGPGRAHTRLADQIRQLTSRGILNAADPVLAAQHLNYLILSIPVNEAMFTGIDQPYDERQLYRFADEAVRVFLAAYGAHIQPLSPASA